MGPYRTPPPPPAPPPGDDWLVYGLLVVLGAVRVAIALFAGQDFGAEATVALIVMTLGAVGLLRACPLRLLIRRRLGPARGPTFGR